MKLADRLEKLGTETAFKVGAQAGEWASRGNKVYPFHLGDINIPTPDNIVEAANRAIRDGKTGYCPAAGIQPLREALAENIGSDRGVSYSPSNISVQPGGKPVIGKFISAVMNPGDEVLYPNPGYPIYESQIEFQGGVAVPYGYIETPDGFAIDMDALKASITPKTKVFIYNNFQNPMSSSSSEEEMAELAELAVKHDLWVLSDDAYYEIQYSKKAKSILSFPGMLERTVVLYTFSKKFAMTGWRLGAAAGPENIIEVISKLNTNIESCSTHFIQYAMVEGIKGDQAGPESILNELKNRRDAAVAGLNAINGINIATPDSTFYLFPNVTNVMERKGFNDLAKFQVEVLHQTGVSFCTRHHFGRPVAGEKDFYIRFAYSGINISEINEGFGKLKEYLNS